MSNINLLFFNILSNFIWTLIDIPTRRSDRMRDATAAIAGSVVETILSAVCHRLKTSLNQWTSCCCCCCNQGKEQWRWKWTKRLASWELSVDGKFSTTQWSVQRAWSQRVFTCSPSSSSVKPTRWNYDLDLGYLKQEAPLPRRVQRVRVWQQLKAHMRLVLGFRYYSLRLVATIGQRRGCRKSSQNLPLLTPVKFREGLVKVWVKFTSSVIRSNLWYSFDGVLLDRLED